MRLFLLAALLCYVIGDVISNADIVDDKSTAKMDGRDETSDLKRDKSTAYLMSSKERMPADTKADKWKGYKDLFIIKSPDKREKMKKFRVKEHRYKILPYRLRTRYFGDYKTKDKKRAGKITSNARNSFRHYNNDANIDMNDDIYGEDGARYNGVINDAGKNVDMRYRVINDDNTGRGKTLEGRDSYIIAPDEATLYKKDTGRYELMTGREELKKAKKSEHLVNDGNRSNKDINKMTHLHEVMLRRRMQKRNKIEAHNAHKNNENTKAIQDYNRLNDNDKMMDDDDVKLTDTIGNDFSVVFENEDGNSKKVQLNQRFDVGRNIEESSTRNTYSDVTAENKKSMGTIANHREIGGRITHLLNNVPERERKRENLVYQFKKRGILNGNQERNTNKNGMIVEQEGMDDLIGRRRYHETSKLVPRKMIFTEPDQHTDDDDLEEIFNGGNFDEKSINRNSVSKVREYDEALRNADQNDSEREILEK